MDNRKLLELIRKGRIQEFKPQDLLTERLSQEEIDDIPPFNPPPLKFPINFKPQDMLTKLDADTPNMSISNPPPNSVPADLDYLSPEVREYASQIMPNLNLKGVRSEEQEPSVNNVQKLLRGEFAKEEQPDPNPITDDTANQLMQDMNNSLIGNPANQMQIPFAPDQQPEEEKEPEVKPTVPVQKAPSASQPKQQTQQEDQGEQPQIPVEQPEEDTREQDALLAGSENRFTNRLFKALSKLGASAANMGLGKIGAVKADTEAFDEMIKESDRPIQLLQLEKQLKSDKAKSDPNSDISKMLRNSLVELGMDMTNYANLSYNQLEKIYPSLTQALYTKMAADARKEQAIIERENRAIAREDRETAREFNQYQKIAGGIDRMVSQLEKSKPMVAYRQAQQAKELLSQAATTNDLQKKVENAAAFMNYAKLAQGDDSVVRSEDMKVLAGNLNYSSPTELLRSFEARTKGTPFTNAELQRMSTVVDTIAKIKKNQLKPLLNPIVTRAQSNNYNLAESLDPAFIDEVYNEPPTAEERMKMLEDKINKNQSRLDELRNKKQGQ
jgi:hypothetical protein